jgi:hypothetical protein
MASGLSGVEFEAPGLIAPSALKIRENDSKSDPKTPITHFAIDKTVACFKISPADNFKSDRLLEKAVKAG